MSKKDFSKFVVDKYIFDFKKKVEIILKKKAAPNRVGNGEPK
jgi:hypothetical protein